MTEEPGTRHVRLVLENDGYAAVERLLAYEIGSQALSVPLALQKRFGLRAEPAQILLVIFLASIQRYIRAVNPDPAYLDRSPMPGEVAGGVSRRRIADVLGLPFETVRRQVNELIADGHVVEHRRGHLNTPPGRLELLSADGIPRVAAVRTIAISNLMLRLGAARIGD